MKGFSNSASDKPLYCNVEGCSLKFDSKDNLLGHKKTHEMTLNLSSPKTAAVDQTPTPTQFIKNCEEVGLFQDLQNVNPFEETFKKAAEAVRTGQPIAPDKSPQLKMSDDSLHTPNIFPDMPQVINIKQEVEWDEPENLEPTEDNSNDQTNWTHVMKKEPPYITNQISQPNTLNTSKSAISSQHMVPGNKLPPNKVFINVPVPVPVRFIAAANSQPPCNVVLVKNSDALYPVPVKNMLKPNLTDKNGEKILPHKVPISKCPARKNTKSLSSKFSNFSKNALKFMAKLENSTPPTENQESNAVPKKKQKVQKKVADIFSKEARIEFLARSRAASSRSREKKKMYIMYLEKVNSELTAKNQNLSLVNVALRKHLKALRTELLRHKTCNVTDKDTEAVLAKADKMLTEEKTPKNDKQVLLTFINPSQPVAVLPAPVCASSLVAVEMPESPPPGEPDYSGLEVAEIIVGEENDQDEIPLSDCSSSPGTIAKFNSVNNVTPAEFPPDSYLGLMVENIPENAKTIHGEHSYFLKKPNLEGNKDLSDAKSRELSRGKSRLRKNVCPKEMTVSKKKESDNRTPPPVLLKPFKKRKLQKRKKCEKT